MIEMNVHAGHANVMVFMLKRRYPAGQLAFMVLEYLPIQVCVETWISQARV